MATHLVPLIVITPLPIPALPIAPTQVKVVGGFTDAIKHAIIVIISPPSQPSWP